MDTALSPNINEIIALCSKIGDFKTLTSPVLFTLPQLILHSSYSYELITVNNHTFKILNSELLL